MRVIEQSCILEPSATDALLHVERAGRVCYKSEDKIKEGSAAKFVRMVLGRGHRSVVEHAGAAVEVPAEVLDDLGRLDAQDTAFIATTRDTAPIVSGNLRAWLELFLKHPDSLLAAAVLPHLKRLHPVFFETIEAPAAALPVPSLPEVRKAVLRTPAELLAHTMRTVRFVTNRGVTHELVRHRPASYSQESTRYCNYGSDHVQYILPVWCSPLLVGDWDSRKILAAGPTDGLPEADWGWLRAMAATELDYQGLIALGWRPEQAREVLPNALKTEIVMTATLAEWRHVFSLRCAGPAHPQIRALMRSCLALFHAEHPDLFADQAAQYLKETA